MEKGKKKGVGKKSSGKSGQDGVKHRKLTGNEISFCKEYINTGKNATQAFKNSTYKTENQKDDTIRNSAYKLLHKPHIQATIEKLEEEAMNQVKEEVAFGLKDTVEGIIKLAKKADRDGDKLKAFDMLMKHFGGYEADNKQGKSDVEVNIPAVSWVKNNDVKSKDDK
jgi:ribosomal protein L17